VSSRLRLLHEWTNQLHALLPGERITRVRVLALFALGMVWAGTVRVNQVAAALPLGVRVPSIERRLRRFLDNAAVTPQALWQPLLPVLLRRWAGQEITLVFDPTPYRGAFTVLWVGIVVHRRVLPLSWMIVPQQEQWPDQLKALLPPLLAPIAAALPPGCQVTLLGDCGLSGPSFLDTTRQMGWEVLLRVNVSAGQTHRLRLLDAAGAPGPEQGLWAVVGTVPSGWHAPAQIFKGAGWRTGHLTVCQRPGFSERWVLFSSRPGGRERIREYARRSRVEATFADGKTRGWGLEHSRMRDPLHLDRLLLAWHLALWWVHALGRLVIRRGIRPHFDRTDRRDRSLVQLGALWLHDELLHDRCPPLLFRATKHGWQVRGAP
jgi:DDE family transposase